ncbi:MAG: hypothetical protein PHQ43_04530 [Dehalococcoidales bacterium]|nr:hypothetical protein [Dehalococcoidales bacterium]
MTPTTVIERIQKAKEQLLAEREDLRRQLDSIESQLYVLERVMAPEVPPEDPSSLELGRV